MIVAFIAESCTSLLGKSCEQIAECGGAHAIFNLMDRCKRDWASQDIVRHCIVTLTNMAKVKSCLNMAFANTCRSFC